jgi:hypothetical protein
LPLCGFSLRVLLCHFFLNFFGVGRGQAIAHLSTKRWSGDARGRGAPIDSVRDRLGLSESG